jgi:RNase P subunit RPR2
MPDRSEGNDSPPETWASDDDHPDITMVTCPRCSGLLVIEEYMDLRDDTGRIHFTALRCAICGEVIDPVILKNRGAQPPLLRYGARRRKFSRRLGGPK